MRGKGAGNGDLGFFFGGGGLQGHHIKFRCEERYRRTNAYRTEPARYFVLVLCFCFFYIRPFMIYGTIICS